MGEIIFCKTLPALKERGNIILLWPCLVWGGGKIPGDAIHVFGWNSVEFGLR